MNNEAKTTLDELLTLSISTLQESKIPSARLDCLIIFEDALKTNRAIVLTEPGRILKKNEVDIIKEMVDRRSKHEPLAYIRGFCEFYGRRFDVSDSALVPRPESEEIITQLKEIAGRKKVGLVIDVGTGSGNLAITAKLEIPDLHVFAIDISESALRIAKKNAKKHNVDIDFCRGDLLLSIPEHKLHKQISIIVANLPYVPNRLIINEPAKYEPKLAIFGGNDGLDAYRKLFKQTALLPKNNGVKYIITESLIDQHKDLRLLASAYGFKERNEVNFVQVFMA
jgi:release factor glutamine methyltransferase